MTNEEILRSIADGKELQRKYIQEEWLDVSHADALTYLVQVLKSKFNTATIPAYTFRVKPEPKSDTVLPAALMLGFGQIMTLNRDYNIKATFDGETNQLKSVRMIGKPDPEKMEKALRDYITSYPGSWSVLAFNEALE